MAKVTIAELETLFTANVDQVAKAEQTVKQTGERIEKKPIEKKIDANAKPALDGMERVEKQAKKLVSERAVMKLDADISRAEKNLARAVDRLEDLHVRAEGGLDVTADVRRAEGSIRRLERHLEGLTKARQIVEVEADTSQAEAALDGVSDAAGEEGGEAGKSLGGGIIAALASIPIAGAIVGVGKAAGEALLSEFKDALQIEASQDRLAALTGLGEVEAQKLARAAGEAYTNSFGDSIEANMDTARLALQFDLVDSSTTTRDSQKVISGLAGIADVLEEDVRPVAQSVTTLLRTGMAESAEEAFDIIAAGARNGVNSAEDMLDTLTEYPSILKRLGISGEEMMGLLNQGLEKGARNSDFVADALKEFQIRATDASESSAKGFERIGLNAEEMTAKIAAGGAGAREGLQQVLDALRETADPVERNAAAVELFGTKAEDLGETLFALDVTTAVDSLDGVTGAAQRMFDTLSDNDATKMEEASRNIEVAADGIKGALASAFSEPLGDFAVWVSEHRGEIMEFLYDLVNGAFDFGITMMESAADASDSLGTIVSGPLASLLEGFLTLKRVMEPFGDHSDLEGLVDDMKAFDEVAGNAADTLRNDAVKGIEILRSRANGVLEPAVAMGHLNDATREVARSLDELGVKADGSLIRFEDLDAANLSATESGRRLEAQVRNTVTALGDEYSAGLAAGEAQETLAAGYETGTQAVADQLVQLGLSEEQAWRLIAAYAEIPEQEVTEILSNADSEEEKVRLLSERVTSLPNKTITVDADTSPAEQSLANLLLYGSRATVGVGPVLPNARGNLVEFMANGGLPGLTPMQPVAQMVPPKTWRVVGDRGDVPELYAPLDGSARSWALILEGLRRMPGSPPQLMAEGAVGGIPSGNSVSIGDIVVRGDGLTQGEIVAMLRDEVKTTVGRALRSR